MAVSLRPSPPESAVKPAGDEVSSGEQGGAPGPILDPLELARLRVATAEGALASAQYRFDEAAARFTALPDSERGWPMPVVYATVALAIVVEWYPSFTAAVVFAGSATPTVLAVTGVFAMSGLLPSVVIGELLRRYRKKNRSHPLVEKVLLGLTVLIALSYLVIAYLVHLEFILPSGGGDPTTKHTLFALALTMVSAMGIALLSIAGYYREALYTPRVRRPLDFAGKELIRRQAERDAALMKLARLDALAAPAEALVAEQLRSIPSAAMPRVLEPSSDSPATPVADVPPERAERYAPAGASDTLPVSTTQEIQAVTRDLDVDFRGERQGYLFFKRTDIREPLSYDTGLRKAKAIVEAIRSSGSDDAQAALERYRGVRLG